MTMIYTNQDAQIDSYVTAGPSGFYSEACVWFDLAKPNQVLVVKFSEWNKWYNAARFANHRIVPPTPAHVADSYEEANAMRDKLNNA